MQRQNASEIEADVVHGHSRFTWLMDEIVAHLRAWLEAPEAADLILDELVVYWTEFRDELRDHITEEETELFPLIAADAGHGEEQALAHLHTQHATLRRLIDLVDTQLVDLLGVDPDERSSFASALAGKTDELREELRAHSRDEREFLRGVQHNISNGCLSS